MLFFYLSFVSILLIPSIAAAQQDSHDIITGRVVALEEISAKETRLTVAVRSGSVEQRRQFLIAQHAIVTGFPRLGVQASVLHYLPRAPVDVALLVSFAPPDSGSSSKHSGSTPLSESQAAVSQNRTIRSLESLGFDPGIAGVTSRERRLCPTSGTVLSFSLTGLKLLQDNASDGELNFSVSPDTRIVGEVLPGETANVCYLTKDGRPFATTIIGQTPKTDHPTHGIREVSGKIVEVNASVLTVEIPYITEITVDEKTEIIGEIHQDVIAQIRYVVSCDDGVKVAIWVKVGAGR